MKISSNRIFIADLNKCTHKVMVETGSFGDCSFGYIDQKGELAEQNVTLVQFGDYYVKLDEIKDTSDFHKLEVNYSKGPYYDSRFLYGSAEGVGDLYLDTTPTLKYETEQIIELDLPKKYTKLASFFKRKETQPSL